MKYRFFYIYVQGNVKIYMQNKNKNVKMLYSTVEMFGVFRSFSCFLLKERNFIRQGFIKSIKRERIDVYNVIKDTVI